MGLTQMHDNLIIYTFTIFALNTAQQPVPSEGSFAQTFKEQLKVFIGKMVIFDVGKILKK